MPENLAGCRVPTTAMTDIRNYILDIIFPRRCLSCDILLGNDSAASYACRHCLAAITFNNNFACAFCRSPVAGGKTCPFCAKEHFLDKLLVTASYETPLVEKMLKSMKYRFVRSLAQDIANLMVKYLKKRLAFQGEVDQASALVVPVPLHFRRLNWRGFNQAGIIAETIGRHFGLNEAAGALKRIRNNLPQAGMPDRGLRIQNAKDIFAPGKIAVAGKTVLLIDDIATTGSTLDDCARALKGAGAKEVIGFVFARNKLKI